MYQLGGHALHLSPEEIQIGKRETPSDTGRVLARYIDAIMVRTFDHGDLEELAGAADVPVINGLSDTHHPCQALADLMTVREELGTLEGTEIAYVGDGNNVAHSLAIACALTGTELTIAHPEGHGPDAEIIDLVRFPRRGPAPDRGPRRGRPWRERRLHRRVGKHGTGGRGRGAQSNSSPPTR